MENVAATAASVTGIPVTTDIVALISSNVLEPMSGTGTPSGGGGGASGAGSVTTCDCEPSCSKVRKNMSLAGPLSSPMTVPTDASGNPFAGS